MKKLIAIVLLLSVFSCQEKRINDILPYEGNKLVLFAELSPKRVIQLEVERTYPPTGRFLFDYSYLDNCTVELYENNKLIETLKRVGKSVLFKSTTSTRPKESNAYHFVVKTDDFPAATSIPQMIPKPVNIVNARFSEKKVTSPLNPSTPSKLLEVELESTEAENGYIIAEIQGTFQGNFTSSNVSDINDSGESTNPCVYNDGSRLKFYDTRCLKVSNLFSYIIEINGNVQVQPYPREDIDQVEVKFSNVNDFYFSFFKDNVQPTGIERVFELSKPTITNIENGYGAVLAKNEQVVYVEVPK